MQLSSILPLLPLPQTHPLVQMFQSKTLIEMHQADENELAIVDGLLGPDFFPASQWLMSMRACVLYQMHGSSSSAFKHQSSLRLLSDFVRAEKQFDAILVADPYRADDIDIFSNILYVTDSRTKLSKLAHHFLQVDKERPEVCCLVGKRHLLDHKRGNMITMCFRPQGNHYSLKAEMEKAIQYFRRATELNQSYLSAWTLMGHEYIEVKNSHAAIESYRRAIGACPSDVPFCGCGN